VAPDEISDRIDTTQASIARVYDAMLGGKDNFPVDRAVRDQITEFAPEIVGAATDGRGFLGRVTTYLAGEVGISQFLDCGAGLPTAENTHQVAQRVNSEATVVYLDNDPVVSAHGRALLEENELSHFLAADLTEPDELLARPEVRNRLDFDQPIALYQVGTLHHVPDELDPAGIMRTYIDALPSGSYVAFAHFFDPDDGSEVSAVARRMEEVCTNSSMASGWWRTKEQILAMLEGLELLEPGVVPVADWWPYGPHLAPLGPARQAYVGIVGKKP
jgi:hypothetical protein